MVDLAMSIFKFLSKFLVFWHPLHPWVCIRSDLKPLFETDMSNSSYCVYMVSAIWNLIRIMFHWYQFRASNEAVHNLALSPKLSDFCNSTPCLVTKFEETLGTYKNTLDSTHDTWLTTWLLHNDVFCQFSVWFIISHDFFHELDHRFMIPYIRLNHDQQMFLSYHIHNLNYET